MKVDNNGRSSEEKSFQLSETAGAGKSSDPTTCSMALEDQLVPLVPSFLNAVPTERSGKEERGIKRSRTTNSPELKIVASDVLTNTEHENLSLSKTEEQIAKKPKMGAALSECMDNSVLKTNINQADLDPSTLSNELSALRKEVTDLIQYAVITKLESMERSLTNLWNQNQRLIRTLVANGINHKTHDELHDNTSCGKPMKIDTEGSVNLNSTFRDRELLKQVHPERLGNVTDTSKPTKNPKPWDSNAATCLRNHQTNISDTEMAPETTPEDVLLKKQAFYTDFGLPLSPRNGYTLKVHSLVGEEPIATEYTNVVADGESIWLELPENAIFMSKFTKRQLTSSRQYWTLNGVTLHQQLEEETGLTPRRQKLAVRCQRDEPSSRLLKGRWYVHAHQIKIQLPSDNPNVWRKLQTAKLIRKLRSTFGPLYHPRIRRNKELPSYWKHKPESNGNVVNARGNKTRENVHKSINLKNLNINDTPRPIPTFFPWPMQAPQPWVNPSYYTGHVPPPTTMAAQKLPAWPQASVVNSAWNYNHTAPSLVHHAQGGVPAHGATIQQHLTLPVPTPRQFVGDGRPGTIGNIGSMRA